MKNYLLMIALLAAFSLFTACQEEPEIELTPFDTEITNEENDPDFFSETDILPVIPVYGDSLLQSFGSRLSMNRFKAKSKEDDFSNTLFDLRDLPINILVRDNPQGLYLTAKRKRYTKWFSSHYSSAPAIFTTKNKEDTKTTSQTFYLKYVPLSGIYGIKTIFDGEDYYMVPGTYDSSSKDHFIYASSDDLTYINSYNFIFQDNGYYSIESELVGSDDPDNPTMENVWQYVLESKDSQSHLAKNRSLAQQQFSIVPLESFNIVKIEYRFDETAVVSKLPDFIVTWSTVNRTSVSQQMSTNFGSSATETSSFSNTAGVSVTTEGSLKVKVPLFEESSFKFSTNVSYSRTWGKSESTTDTRNYNFQVTVPAYSRVVATAQVSMNKLNVGYTTYLKGVNSGREIRISGVWEGVECGNIVTSYTQYDLDTDKKIGSRTFDGIPLKVVSL